VVVGTTSSIVGVSSQLTILTGEPRRLSNRFVGRPVKLCASAANHLPAFRFEGGRNLLERPPNTCVYALLIVLLTLACLLCSMRRANNRGILRIRSSFPAVCKGERHERDYEP